MFTRFILFSLVMLGALTAQASQSCFIAKEGGKIVKQMGACNQRHSPFSTFKIAIALMGYDAGILKTPEEPKIVFTNEIKKNFASYSNPVKYPIQLFSSRDQTPATWMKYSVIWYSQEITKKLGIAKFKEYIAKLSYGNMDASGDAGKNNGLLNAWLDSSLQISPLEQVEFLEKLKSNELPLSKKAQWQVPLLIALEDIWDDWKLYGKTGGGMEQGWFVGWIDNGDRQITFAQYIDNQSSPISAGRTAKELAKDNLISLVLKDS